MRRFGMGDSKKDEHDDRARDGPDADTKVVESGQEGMARMSAVLRRILQGKRPAEG